MTDQPLPDPYADAIAIAFDTADLAAYLDRIGHTRRVAPDRATLAALLAAHLETIAFENLDPVLRRTPDLSREGLMGKLVDGGRGGYCFEQNGLLLGMLRVIGFEAYGLAARVHWGSPPDAVQPRRHMLIHVVLAGVPHIVDAGFGGMTPTGVLRLEADVEQATPHEPCRLRRAGDHWVVEPLVAGEWREIYRFDLTRQAPVDYHAANYYLAQADASHFTQDIVAARHSPGIRRTFGKNIFTRYRTGEPPERRKLEDSADICALLEGEFGIRIPDRAALIARMAGPEG